MSFQFVAHDKIDATVRKQIRSHVMKRKNLGRVRVGQTRIGRYKVGCSPKSGSDSLMELRFMKDADDGNMTDSFSLPRLIRENLSTFSFPIELQPYMIGLLNQCQNQSSSLPIYFY